MQQLVDIYISKTVFSMGFFSACSLSSLNCKRGAENALDSKEFCLPYFKPRLLELYPKVAHTFSGRHYTCQSKPLTPIPLSVLCCRMKVLQI